MSFKAMPPIFMFVSSKDISTSALSLQIIFIEQRAPRSLFDLMGLQDRIPIFLAVAVFPEICNSCCQNQFVVSVLWQRFTQF
ncbi:hypothetical protein T03_7045 [Trichinella britovi]|uniref:Uncharacterized protein n=1 Tax=Trichinella britovi TaxID=45882 RepID=A0A0V1AM12_TRIBR|nr:hypothetical protein T03_7045 [Trichinella britovi]